ncbi:MAG: hypothetical protein CLLPBCKN_001635 [Chroococcidiopsis cubana SAG 39.79]|nr:hypothetical protein [Chroococcidiopsis cubana SAG 39.79]
MSNTGKVWSGLLLQNQRDEWEIRNDFALSHECIKALGEYKNSIHALLFIKVLSPSSSQISMC